MMGSDFDPILAWRFFPHEHVTALVGVDDSSNKWPGT